MIYRIPDLNLYDTTLVVSKKQKLKSEEESGGYVKSLDPVEYNSEEEIVRELYQESGTGEYSITACSKGYRGFFPALAKYKIWEKQGEGIRSGKICYSNLLDRKYFESSLDIRQSGTSEEHNIKASH